MPNTPNRAVVLGASLAGLLAARVLSERFAEVVLIERDALPGDASPRKGTPHAVQPHGLLARGRQVLEQLFPGFTAAMVARGGLLGDMTAEVGFEANGERFAACDAGMPALGASRLAIEAELRARVLALPGVRAVTGVQGLAPRHQAGDLLGRVVAARYADLDDPSRVHELAADLVVDCTGRGSHAPQWLRDWGYAPPIEERVHIGICYTSAYFKRTGGCAIGPGFDKVATFGAVTNAQPRPGVLIAQEPDASGTPRWVAGVGGFRGDHAPATLQAMRERALAIGGPELIKVTHEGEMLGEPMRYQMPYSQRRRYERLARVPEGFLAMGDAITSFNPIYGQGMTVAACEALALREQLTHGLLSGLGPRFFRAAAQLIDTPWQLAVGGDLAIDAVPGDRPLPVRVVNAYVARIYRAAVHDPVVSLAFQRVVHMLDAPAKLFAPRLLWRVMMGSRRRATPAVHDLPGLPVGPVRTA
jgi:2-polyprenyl-6-methoxyphenol hydroxylase-like FAD-dependent oxidoreductase